MKSKLTTTFALLGVLAAGTAAAAVNTQALQSRAASTIGVATTFLITPTGKTAIDPATQVIQLDANVSSTSQTPAAQTPAPAATAPATQTAASPTAATIPVTVPQAQPTAATATIAATPTQSKPTFNNEDDDEEGGDDDDD